MEIQTSGGEIIGILKMLKDEMSADLADSQKGKDASKAKHAGLIVAKKHEIVTVTLQTNLGQGEAEEKSSH